MNKLTLKILILFFLFIYSHELTDSQIIRNEIKNFTEAFRKSCKEVYKDETLNPVLKKKMYWILSSIFTYKISKNNEN